MASSFTVLSLSSPISLPAFKPPFPPSLNLPLFLKSRLISVPFISMNAKNKNRQREASSAVKIEFDDDGADDDEEYREEYTEEEDTEFMAFEDMRKWELQKPLGFGEGKVYDTTVEEKLLEEIEKERTAQIASGNKKGKSGLVEMKEEQQPKKGVFLSGPSVRLGNLPKKKNIHRDLEIAFKGFAGIVNISPAVTGNQKTRDPICKGFAFVEFKSKDAAIRFVQTYSKKDIAFGKLQKQISCKIIKSGQVADGGAQTSSKTNFMNFRHEAFHEKLIGGAVDDFDAKSKKFMSDVGTLSPNSEVIETRIKHLSVSLPRDDKNDRNADGLGSDNLVPGLPKQIKQIAAKKKLVKKKPAKSGKLSLPASLARLKIKERTVLTGVFEKYGQGVASASD